MDGPFDVAVVGGGPAGTSIAIALARNARAGRSVAVLERSSYAHARVGETLPPEARVPLARLGVWDRFLEQRHAPSPGTVSAWGQEETEENDFIFNPYGNGWHLDRRRFDAMLASAAAEAGATLHRNARMTAYEHRPSGEWRVEYVCDGRPGQLQARFLVDATGRACSAARRQGATRLRTDRLTGVIGLFEAFQLEPPYRMLVEATAHGWWYSARLPDTRLVAAFMTDADLLPLGQSQLLGHWLQQLQSTVHTRLRTTGLTVERPLRWMAAASEVLECSGGPRWLATGDAALSFDPLSSQGIYQALQSGLMAAETIEAVLQGQTSATLDWSRRNRNIFDRYLRTRQAYYGLERRWPESVFWRRRH
jgi:flavin-dependent dehydrogenase